MRLASTATTDAHGNVSYTITPVGKVHEERFEWSTVATPNVLASGLTRFVKAFAELGRAVYANRRVQTVTFTGITCGTAGALVKLSHNLGRQAQWSVVKWRGSATTTNYALVSDESDASPTTTTNLLALRSYVAGVADIEVF